MDSKDFKLLVALFVDARQSFRDLGRRVGLSHPVVRARLKRLERRGILQGFFLTVNPKILGREDLLVRFDGDWTRADALKALEVPEVAWVAWKLNGNLTVQLWPRGRVLAMERLKTALRANPSGQFIAEPGQRLRMPSLTDWQIIDALADDPIVSLNVLIEKTGLSPKTVRNHLVALLRSGTVRISPKVGALADSGEVVYTISVFGKVGVDEVRKIIGDAFLIKQFHHPPAKHLLCCGSDLGDVLAKTRALERLAAVTKVSISLNREQLIATGNLHSLVREQIRALEAAKLK